MDQALRLRGSRDFANREEYLRFLRDLVAARNANRQKRFAEELAALRPLPAQRLESSRRLTDIAVGAGSTIQVLRNTYSVHSRLIGRKVDVVIGVEEVEVWHADILVAAHAAVVGERQACDQLPAHHRLAGPQAGCVRQLRVPRGPVPHESFSHGVRRAVPATRGKRRRGNT